jgi:hypothetical protein
VESFGRLLPLRKPSAFGDNEIIQVLMTYSAGLTGKITTQLTQAAELAIRSGEECITPERLQRAAAAGIFKLSPVHDALDA